MRRAWLVLAFIACDREPRRVELDLSREHDSAITLAGVSFTTVFEQGADEGAPLLVMLHGEGDTARQFREAWPAFPFKLQLSFPLAPLASSNGARRWLASENSDQDGEALSAAEARLWPAIELLARGRQVMIGGFSQGAVVAYAIAARHPEAVPVAFLIGGRIPRGSPPSRVPIVALHGLDDRAIPIAQLRDDLAARRAAGQPATLVELPGGHAISPAMFEELARQVRARR